MPGPTFNVGDVDYVSKLNTLSNAILTMSTQTAGFTAVKGNWYIVKTNAITVTLPLTPAAGDLIRLSPSNAATVITVTLGRNGNNIDSVAADKVITGFGDTFLLYIDGTIGWLQLKDQYDDRGRTSLIVNGDFDVAQQATTQALTTAVAYGSVDMWAFKTVSASATASQANGQTAGFVGFKNCLKFGRDVGQAAVGIISAQTCFETVDCAKYQGKTVTLSLYIKAGANFSAASSLLALKLYTGTGTDQSLVSMEAGTWTGSATPINVTQAISSTVTRYTFTVALGTTITQIGLQLSFTPVGTAGADDNVYVTGVRLHEGSIATPPDFRSQQAEIALCERHYQVCGNGAEGAVVDATRAEFGVPLRTVMRAVPTVALLSSTPVLRDPGNAVFTAAAATISVVTSGSGASQRGFGVLVNGFAGMTAFHPVDLCGDYFSASARL